MPRHHLVAVAVVRSAVVRSAVALFVALAACRQPLTLTPSDAATVLAHRTITAPNPGERGNYVVRRLYYGSGTDRRRSVYRDSVTYRTATVDASPFVRLEPGVAKSRRSYWGFDATAFPRNARVWYPEGPGPFPLVLIVHGNHDMKEYSDPGYAWLGELLASRGFILASIDENFLNGGIREENDARGWMLLKHLELFRSLNDSAGKPLAGRIDLHRIALMGHSRGGEAVAVAGAFNRLPAYPDDATRRFDFHFDIRALVAIAPVDGQYKPAEQPTPLRDYSYLVIHGSHDGDVSSFSGLAQYHRLRFTQPGDQFKSAIWMYRANHGQWNTVWNNHDNGDQTPRTTHLQALVSGEEQRRFGRVVIGGFLEATLRGRTEYRALFEDHRSAGEWLPPTMYLTRFADARTTWLATFDEDVDVTTGTVPGVRLTGDSLSVWKEGDVLSRGRQSFRSNAVTLGWNNTPVGPDTATPRAPARFSITLTDSLRTALAPGPAGALLLSIGSTTQRPGPRRAARDSAVRDSAARGTPARRRPAASRPPKDTVPPDLSIEVVDAAGHTASLPLSTFGAVRQPIETVLYRRAGRDRQRFGTLSEPVMQTYRAPLARFVAVNGAFDPAMLSSIRLVFDRTRVGAILLDEVGVSR